MTQDSPPQFDPSSFSTAPFKTRIEKPWGWELYWTPPERTYVGKILHIRAGMRLSLQIHDEKHESWLLMDGQAKVAWDNAKGELEEHELTPGEGYSCVPGQRHRLIGITDCDIVEVSTPELGTTWRLEDDFGRPHETPELRSLDHETNVIDAS